MKHVTEIGLADVQAVYDGPEGDLWELVMGQQIHIGGLRSSQALAKRAEVGAGMNGVDLCCCSGAGMRFLVRYQDVDRMHGVDATPTVVNRGRRRCEDEGLDDRIRFSLADVCDSGLPDASADFVWGEDAWCYVVDKSKLVSEATRLTKPGGVIAFTDWIEGPTALTDDEAKRFLRFMKFPNIEDLEGYAGLLRDNACEVVLAEDTGRFPRYIDLYLNMLDMQLTYDALRLIGFNMSVMESMQQEMQFMQDLAHAGKIAQGMFVGRKVKKEL